MKRYINIVFGICVILILVGFAACSSLSKSPGSSGGKKFDAVPIEIPDMDKNVNIDTNDVDYKDIIVAYFVYENDAVDVEYQTAVAQGGESIATVSGVTDGVFRITGVGDGIVNVTLTVKTGGVTRLEISFAVTVSHSEPPPRPQKATDLPIGFYTASNWAKMTDDSNDAIQQVDDGIKFRQNNCGYNLGFADAINGKSVQYSFMLKAGNVNNQSWTVRLGASENKNNGTTYYALHCQYSQFYILRNATWAAHARYADTAYSLNQWNRFDLFVQNENGALRIWLYINYMQVAFVKENSIASVAYERGVFADSSPLTLGAWAQVKVWGADLEFKPVDGDAAPYTRVRVAAVGDSLTYGHSWNGESYPVALAAALGGQYNVRNLGHNGASVTGFGGDSAVGAYKTTAEYAQSLAFNPDIVLIMLGSNDSSAWSKAQAKFESEFTALVDAYKNRNPDVKIIIMTSPQIASNAAFAGNAAAAATVNNIIRTEVKLRQESVASATGATVADIHGLIRNMIDGGDKDIFRVNDGVHFTWHAAQAVATFLKDIIESPV
ncbi:MAG: GDSL-type esterase/lipase family protein [Clostridiaceae bacterium]|jgi:lysophospholipase L1-like esterase|nr:GDSL-type esterase/lipase family protein [Clostridiaceae bacterium]